MQSLLEFAMDAVLGVLIAKLVIACSPRLQAYRLKLYRAGERDGARFLDWLRARQHRNGGGKRDE